MANVGLIKHLGCGRPRKPAAARKIEMKQGDEEARSSFGGTYQRLPGEGTGGQAATGGMATSLT